VVVVTPGVDTPAVAGASLAVPNSTTDSRATAAATTTMPSAERPELRDFMLVLSS
jgi:hypothetical protein